MNLTSRLLFVALAGSLTMCTSIIPEANQAYLSENYGESAELCEKAFAKIENNKKKKGDMAYKTAMSYMQTGKAKDASSWFETCILLDYQDQKPEVYLYNGDMLVIMEEFDKAKEQYELYKNLVPDDPRADVGIQACVNAKNYEKDRTRHKVEYVELLNVSQMDMAPMIGDARGTVLYYSSSRDGSMGKSDDPRTGEGYMDLWMTTFDKNGNPTEPSLVAGEGINTIDNEGTVCFDSRFKTMFFTRCPNLKKQNLGCDIWMAEGKKNEWEAPVKIEGLKNHDTVSVGHPCTKDGQYLIFASDMPGGFGGRDLWYTQYDRRAETWSAPVNMGPEINTKGDELFPSFAKNGDLFFASNGRPGMGGLDIYRAASVGENKWANPENLKAPINSTGNDYAIVEIDERTGYFTSERKSAAGEFMADLYKYELPPNLFTLKVIVSELGNEKIKIEDVKVVVEGTDKTKWEGFTLADGSVYWDKRPVANAQGDRYINEQVSYKINISKDGYHEDKKGATISTEGLEEGYDFIQELSLLPKTPIRLPEVRYPLDQWVLLVDSTINSPDSLQFVYDLLEEYPSMVLELSSHTDSRGKNERNEKLSVNRARACYKYLVEEKNVDPRRIVPVGKGENEPRKVWLKGEEIMESRPVDMTGVEEIELTEKYINTFQKSDPQKFKYLHQLNRRTEGRVLNMDFDPATAPAANPEYKEYVPYP